MNPAVRVLKNSSALSISILLERGIAFFLPVYMARVEGVEIWGTYNVVLPFIFIAVPFATWGLDQLLPREIARGQEKAGLYLGNAVIISSLASIVITLLIIPFISLLNYEADLEQIIIFALLLNVLPRTEAAIFEATIYGLEKMEWVAVARGPLTIVRTILSILLLRAGYGLTELFLLLGIFFVLVIGIYLVLFYTQIPGWRIQIDLRGLWPLAVQALPFLFIIFTGEAFRQVDRIFISKLWDVTAVAFYATGTLLVQIMFLVAPALMNALFPGLSRVYITSIERFTQLTGQLFKLLLLLIFPVMLTIIATADIVIPLVFGDEYLESISIPVLQIAALSIVPAYLARLLYRVMLASNQERLAGRTVVLRSLANLLLNAVLISRYGIIGAAVALVGTESIALTQNIYYVNKKVVPFNFRQALLQPGLIALLCLGLFGLLHQTFNHILAGIMVLTVFLLLLFLTKTVTIAELSALFSERKPAQPFSEGL